MPPKKATSEVDYVDGVHYSLNLGSKMVCVGTGVVSNNERDTFRQKTTGADCPSLADQIRGRPKWQAILAAAAAKEIPEAVAAIAESAGGGAAGSRTSAGTAGNSVAGGSASSSGAVCGGAASHTAGGGAASGATAGDSAVDNSGPAGGHTAAAGSGCAIGGCSSGSASDEAAGDDMQVDGVAPCPTLNTAPSMLPAQQPQSGAEAQDAEMQQRVQPAQVRRGYRECWVCHVPNKEWAPAGCSDAEASEWYPVARIGKCACGADLCNSPCSRRGACPSHAGWALTQSTYSDVAGPAKLQVYAEVAAGIGCRCACCLRLFRFMDQAIEGWQLHAPRGPGFGDEEDAREQRRWVRDALAKAGNPDCCLRDLVLQCDACEGNCGMELWDGSICGGGALVSLVSD